MAGLENSDMEHNTMNEAMDLIKVYLVSLFEWQKQSPLPESMCLYRMRQHNSFDFPQQFA